MNDFWTLDIERTDGVVSLVASCGDQTKAIDLPGDQFTARKDALCGALRTLAEAIQKNG